MMSFVVLRSISFLKSFLEIEKQYHVLNLYLVERTWWKNKARENALLCRRREESWSVRAASIPPLCLAAPLCLIAFSISTDILPKPARTKCRGSCQTGTSHTLGDERHEIHFTDPVLVAHSPWPYLCSVTPWGSIEQSISTRRLQAHDTALRYY